MDRKDERDRLRQIISVFIKHGMKDGIKSIMDPGQVRAALEELGPTFIKIGQILSTRSDILPETFIQEFEKLQDRVKPEKYEDIKNIVESELKGEIDDIFQSFEKTAIASASMAQVHLAILKDGREVVVKIQRPNIKETMFRDIAILKRLVRFTKYVPQANVMDPREVVDELESAVKRELDFLNEAENIKKFYQLNHDVKYIKCPEVYDGYTTQNVLVMEYIEGFKIIDTESLNSQGYDVDDIARKLASNYFKQIFEDGFFHADPHPGNIFITGRKIAYIDFGIMGTLDNFMREKLNMFLYGAAARDIEAMVQAIFRIGIKKGTIDSRRLYSDIEQIYNSYVEVSLDNVDLPQMVEEIFKVCRKNNISIPKEVTMLLRGILTIEGVIAKLAPEINIMDIAVPYVRNQIISSRKYTDDITEQLGNLYKLSKSGTKIPLKLLELINCMLSGKLKVQLEHTNLEDSINNLNRMVNRIVFGLIVSALIIGSSVVINTAAGPKVFGLPVFGFIGYTGAAVMGFYLLISILQSGKM